MLNVGRLRVLREVAYRGSLSAAAEALSYTQSAVSQQIAALESETGMALLERHPRGVSLTAAGHTLIAHAEAILAEIDAAEHPLARRKRVRLENLREEAWVQTSGASACARHVVRCCHAAGYEPRVSFESDDYQTVQGLVAAGVGVALIPELALTSVREDIE